MRESRVEIDFAYGKCKRLDVNGHSLLILDGAELHIERGLTVLQVRLPVLHGAIRGHLAVEIVNAPLGSRMVRDEKGRLWIEPEEAAEPIDTAGDRLEP